MEQSTIFDLIEDAYLDDWRNNIKKADECEYYKILYEREQSITEGLTDMQKKKLKLYACSIANCHDFTAYNLMIKTLNLGIKIGMDIQKSLSDK